MAKKEKEAEKPSKKDDAPEFKYGVKELADKLELEPASVRVKLRNAGVKKAGKSYGWNTKAELQEVVDQLQSDDKPKGKKDDDKKSSKKSKDADEKPKKGKSKKSSDDEDDEEDEKPSKKSKKSKSKDDEDDD